MRLVLTLLYGVAIAIRMSSLTMDGRTIALGIWLVLVMMNLDRWTSEGK